MPSKGVSFLAVAAMLRATQEAELEASRPPPVKQFGLNEPEIEEPVVIRNARDLPEGLMPHMQPMIDWHFSGGVA